MSGSSAATPPRLHHHHFSVGCPGGLLLLLAVSHQRHSEAGAGAVSSHGVLDCAFGVEQATGYHALLRVTLATRTAVERAVDVPGTRLGQDPPCMPAQATQRMARASPCGVGADDGAAESILAASGVGGQHADTRRRPPHFRGGGGASAGGGAMAMASQERVEMWRALQSNAAAKYSPQPQAGSAPSTPSSVVCDVVKMTMLLCCLF